MFFCSILCDASVYRQLSFQDAASPIMEGIINLHNNIMMIITFIFLFVFFILVVSRFWGNAVLKSGKTQRVYTFAGIYIGLLALAGGDPYETKKNLNFLSNAETFTFTSSGWIILYGFCVLGGLVFVGYRLRQFLYVYYPGIYEALITCITYIPLVYFSTVVGFRFAIVAEAFLYYLFAPVPVDFFLRVGSWFSMEQPLMLGVEYDSLIVSAMNSSGAGNVRGGRQSPDTPTELSLTPRSRSGSRLSGRGRDPLSINVGLGDDLRTSPPPPRTPTQQPDLVVDFTAEPPSYDADRQNDTFPNLHLIVDPITSSEPTDSPTTADAKELIKRFEGTDDSDGSADLVSNRVKRASARRAWRQGMPSSQKGEFGNGPSSASSSPAFNPAVSLSGPSSASSSNENPWNGRASASSSLPGYPVTSSKYIDPYEGLDGVLNFSNISHVVNISPESKADTTNSVGEVSTHSTGNVCEQASLEFVEFIGPTHAAWQDLPFVDLVDQNTPARVAASFAHLEGRPWLTRAKMDEFLLPPPEMNAAYGQKLALYKSNDQLSSDLLIMLGLSLQYERERKHVHTELLKFIAETRAHGRAEDHEDLLKTERALRRDYSTATTMHKYTLKCLKNIHIFRERFDAAHDAFVGSVPPGPNKMHSQVNPATAQTIEELQKGVDSSRDSLQSIASDFKYIKEQGEKLKEDAEMLKKEREAFEKEKAEVEQKRKAAAEAKQWLNSTFASYKDIHKRAQGELASAEAIIQEKRLELAAERKTLDEERIRLTNTGTNLDNREQELTNRIAEIDARAALLNELEQNLGGREQAIAQNERELRRQIEEQAARLEEFRRTRGRFLRQVARQQEENALAYLNVRQAEEGLQNWLRDMHQGVIANAEDVERRIEVLNNLQDRRYTQLDFLFFRNALIRFHLMHPQCPWNAEELLQENSLGPIMAPRLNPNFAARVAEEFPLNAAAARIRPGEEVLGAEQNPNPQPRQRPFAWRLAGAIARFFNHPWWWELLFRSRSSK